MGPGKHGDPLSIKACQFFSKCEYLGQFRSRARVIIYTHAYLPLDRNSKERKKPSLVIIDESFLSTCLTTSEIPVAQLPSPLATVLVEACNVEAQKKPFLAFLRKKKMTSALVIPTTKTYRILNLSRTLRPGGNTKTSTIC
jgi:hypothetical protein